MILDTNAYTALQMGKKEVIGILAQSNEIFLPLPVVAELRFGFLGGTKSEDNEQRLQRFLSQPAVIILEPSVRTTEKYAQVAVLCRKKGRALSHNDLWIAALALESGKNLVTYDKDFDVLTDIFAERLILLG